MGTNYYVHVNECSCCGRFDRLHFGKSATQVQAFLRSGDDGEIRGGDDWERNVILPFEIDSLGDWEHYLASVPHSCWNEYGDPLDTDGLFTLFRSSNPNARAAQYEWEVNHYDGGGMRTWLDAEGFSVSLGGWS